MMHQFSVIVPIYNAEKHLQKCIESLMNQTMPCFELILINDGSTDGSQKICEKYLHDSRIKLVNKVNGGVSRARNSGLQVARGSYIIFVDSDDYVKNTLCEEYNRILSEFDCDLIVSGFQLQISKPGLDINKKSGKLSGIYKKEELSLYFSKMFQESYLHPVWSKCYKRNLIYELFDTSLSLGEDLIFNLKYLQYCRNIYFLDRSLYVYNVGVINSLSSKYSLDGFANLKKSYIETIILLNNIWSGNANVAVVKEKMIIDNCVMAERLVQQHIISLPNIRKIICDELVSLFKNDEFKDVKLNCGFKWNAYYRLIKNEYILMFYCLVKYITLVKKILKYQVRRV